MSMYLVTNIKINQNESFDCEIPKALVGYGFLSKPYVHTYALNCQEVTFDYEQLTAMQIANCYSTEYHSQQPTNLELLDEKYDQYVAAKAIPMPKACMLIEIFDFDLQEFDNDIELAIYNKLLDYLDVDYIITFN